MAGMASSELRSAFVAESTAGTIPSTPSFTNFDAPLLMKATPTIAERKTLAAQGAREGQAVGGREVSGSVSDQMAYGAFDEMLETLFQGAWSTNVLKDGKSVKTVAIENAIAAGVGGTTTMMRYRGVEAVSGTIAAQSREPINISMDLRGRGSDDATTTAITGATYTDQAEKTPLTSGLDVGSITFNGYTLDCFQRVEMQFNYEGRDDQPKLGSYDLCGITRGALVPVINARIYVDSNFLAIYNAARANHTAFSVSVPLGSVSGSKYTVEFPVCAFASGDLDFGAADAMHDIVIYPQFDATTENCVVKITRAVS